jgi:O-antigen ligase
MPPMRPVREDPAPAATADRLASPPRAERRVPDDLGPSELARLLPAAGVLVTWAVLMFSSGGYDVGTWLPAGLVLAALLVLAAVGGGRLLPPGRNERRALGALLAFTAWCFVSIAWSDARGPSWEAANLLLVVSLGAWVLVLAPWRARTAQLLMIAYSSVVAAASVADVVGALAQTDLTSRFEDFRYAGVLHYPNATAALAFMAAIPALVLAARPGGSVALKGLAQGLATFLCAYGLLPLSRGSILGGLAALVVLAIAVPFRWRLVLHGLLLLAAVGTAAGSITAVYDAAATTGRASEPLGDALTAILLATGGGAAFGLLLARLEERVVLDDVSERRARLGAIGAAVLAAVALATLVVVKLPAIQDTAAEHWKALTNPGQEFGGAAQEREDAGRLGRTDPQERYDYWRVAVGGFLDDPVIGMGAGGFEQRYSLERRFRKPSRYPHNVALKVLGDTGLVGTALMIAFTALIAAGLLRSRAARRRSRERAVAATALGTFAYFAAHGMFDWLEAYAVLAGPAIAFPLVAMSVGSRGRAPALPAGAPTPRVWAPAALVAVLAAASYLAPWVAHRHRERGAEIWRSAPAAAYREFDRAARWNPLDADPLVIKGAVALTREDLPTATAAFGDALERREQWLPHFGLAVVADQRGDQATVERELDAALRAHPEDLVLPEVAERVRNRGAVDPARALRDVLTASQATRERIS